MFQKTYGLIIVHFVRDYGKCNFDNHFIISNKYITKRVYNATACNKKI